MICKTFLRGGGGGMEESHFLAHSFLAIKESWRKYYYLIPYIEFYIKKQHYMNHVNEKLLIKILVNLKIKEKPFDFVLYQIFAFF